MTEDAAHSAEHWLVVARSIAGLPDGQVQALRCMARALLAARDAREWATVARAWQQDFDDPAMAHLCMAKAESCAEDSDDGDDWITVGDAWAAMGYGSKAIEIARTYFEPGRWRYLEELETAHGTFPPGTTVLDWVEPGMTERASRDAASNVKEAMASSYMEAILHLVDAEAFAESFSDYVRIARMWADLFEETERASECLENAESLAENCYHLMRLAKVWKENLHDQDAAVRCMQAAENNADDEEDWTEIAKIWEETFQDMNQAKRCMQEAERAGRENEDLEC